ncbi:MAG TPA: hypothetical protein VGN26_06335 [Armatimonadota bacterium]|jgi:hypothetical protein
MIQPPAIDHRVVAGEDQARANTGIEHFGAAKTIPMAAMPSTELWAKLRALVSPGCLHPYVKVSGFDELDALAR